MTHKQYLKSVSLTLRVENYYQRFLSQLGRVHYLDFGTVILLKLRWWTLWWGENQIPRPREGREGGKTCKAIQQSILEKKNCISKPSNALYQYLVWNSIPRGLGFPDFCIKISPLVIEFKTKFYFKLWPFVMK